MTEQEKDFQHEADFLAAILEHDGVSQDMRGYISDIVLELQGEVSLYTPAVLRVAWPLIRQQELASGDAFWRSVVIALRAFANAEMDQLLDEINEATRAADSQAKGQNARAELAAHLAAVMKHPETPMTVHDALGEALTEMTNAIDFDTPEMIERSLEAFKRQGSQEEGGRR